MVMSDDEVEGCAMCNQLESCDLECITDTPSEGGPLMGEPAGGFTVAMVEWGSQTEQ